MSTWMKTRLAVVLNGDTLNPLSPLESFTPTFNLGTEVVHSIEATHIGYIANPESFTFSMTVKAIGDAAAKLMRIAMNGSEFDIGVYEAQGGSGEWDFKSIVLRQCVITSASPSNATINGAPVATFSGIARAAETEDQAGEETLPTFTG